jgi:hypothetical protein
MKRIALTTLAAFALVIGMSGAGCATDEPTAVQFLPGVCVPSQPKQSVC